MVQGLRSCWLSSSLGFGVSRVSTFRLDFCFYLFLGFRGFRALGFEILGATPRLFAVPRGVLSGAKDWFRGFLPFNLAGRFHYVL